jgi:hypothetical protein
LQTETAVLIFVEGIRLMERDRKRPSLKKLWSYFSLLERANPLRYRTISNPSPSGRKLSPEELEEQKRQYQRFLLLQTLGR